MSFWQPRDTSDESYHDTIQELLDDSATKHEHIKHLLFKHSGVEMEDDYPDWTLVGFEDGSPAHLWLLELYQDGYITDIRYEVKLRRGEADFFVVNFELTEKGTLWRDFLDL